MEFRNRTPFAALNFKMLDKDGEEHDVIALKAGYQLIKTANGDYRADLLDTEPVPLCMEDKYSGEVNASSVYQESDLAPYKPLCDVIINGTAKAPDGVAVTSFPVGIKLTDRDGRLLLYKRLRICGPRYYNGRSLSEPQPFTELKLGYEQSFGGECRIDEEHGHSLAATYRLTESQRLQHPDKEHPPLAHSVCEANPTGVGFIEPWYAAALNIKEYPAPRIESFAAPFSAAVFKQMLDGRQPKDSPALRPYGFGIIGRAWQPRRAKAGTYDKKWLAERHPYLPDDFDFNYWNGAPEDQQIAYPYGLHIELENLTPDKLLRVDLPHHRALLLLRMNNGSLIPRPMVLDTLIIDSDRLLITTTYRTILETDISVRVTEVRFEVDQEAPVIRTLSSKKDQNIKE